MSNQYNVTLYLTGGGDLTLGQMDEDGLNTIFENLGQPLRRMRFTLGNEIHLIPLTSVHSIRATLIDKTEV